MSRSAFAGRALGLAAFASGSLSLSLVLALGAWGYHAVAALGWVDAMSNAAMILSGMGSAAEMPTDAAKPFASACAILAGIAWTALPSVILYPFVHRPLHVLHLQAQGEGD